jgi:hypothetical protein
VTAQTGTATTLAAGSFEPVRQLRAVPGVLCAAVLPDGAACDRLARLPLRSDELCDGHRKQRDRGTPLRSLAVRAAHSEAARHRAAVRRLTTGHPDARAVAADLLAHGAGPYRRPEAAARLGWRTGTGRPAAGRVRDALAVLVARELFRPGGQPIVPGRTSPQGWPIRDAIPYRPTVPEPRRRRSTAPLRSVPVARFPVGDKDLRALSGPLSPTGESPARTSPAAAVGGAPVGASPGVAAGDRLAAGDPARSGPLALPGPPRTEGATTTPLGLRPAPVRSGRCGPVLVAVRDRAQDQGGNDEGVAVAGGRTVARLRTVRGGRPGAVLAALRAPPGEPPRTLTTTRTPDVRHNPRTTREDTPA